MKKLINISDDLTGANALSVLLTKNGIKCISVIDFTEEISDYNAISYSTNSRGLTKDESYKKVNDIVKKFKYQDEIFFSKRIDSTLRGNIGAEIDAIIDEIPDSFAVVVAAYPTSFRISVGGYLLVNSIPLQETSVSKDSKCPLTTSKISEILKNQSKHSVGHIGLDETLLGIKNIEKEIDRLSKNNKIIVIDATTNEGIDTIANACKNLNKKIIPVDPGPFTASYFKLISEKTIKINKKIMLVIGSVSDLTMSQLDNIKAHFSSLLIKIDSKKLLNIKTRNSEVMRVIDELSNKVIDYDVVGVITAIEENDVVDLFNVSKELNITVDEASNIINRSLAEITLTLVNRYKNIIGGLYTSGGDVTLSVCQSFGVYGIEVKDEIAPLTVYGRLIGNNLNALPIVTKGGLIGDKNTGVECIRYLQTKISTEIVSI